MTTISAARISLKRRRDTMLRILGVRLLTRLLVLICSLSLLSLLFLNRCGFNSLDADLMDTVVANGILDGEIATIKQFPHQVSVRSGQKHICGGSFISPTHVLTAAHCFMLGDYEINSDITVLSGTNKHEDWFNGGIHEVYMIIYHPEYDPLDYHLHDIAIVKITELFLSSIRKPIPLPTEDIQNGAFVKISGWGIWQKNGTFLSGYLRKVSMYVLQNELCGSLWDFPISSELFCSMALDGKTVMNGDSGGGLIHGKTVVGIVSAGGSLTLPIIATRIFPYLDWIKYSIQRY